MIFTCITNKKTTFRNDPRPPPDNINIISDKISQIELIKYFLLFYANSSFSNLFFTTIIIAP